VNWLASRVTLRIRSLPEVFDLGFVFLGENRKAYTRLALLTLVVPLGATALLQFAHVPWWEIWGVAIVLGTLVEGMFTTAAGQLLFSASVPMRRLFGLFARRMISYSAARILAALAMAAGAPFIIPIPPIAARSLFVSECSLLESASPAGCLRRGGQLMAGQTGPGAIFALLLLVFRFAFIVTAEELGQGLVEFVLQLGRPVGSLFDDGGSTFALAGFFASIPYVASTRFLGYVDRRTRREGWDIQVRFAALAQREGGEEAAA
jgi:hypothetical protein